MIRMVVDVLRKLPPGAGQLETAWPPDVPSDMIKANTSLARLSCGHLRESRRDVTVGMRTFCYQCESGRP